jgi:WD40 repeat protein
LVKQLIFKNHHYNFIEIPTCSYWNTLNTNSIYVSYIAPYIKLYDIETAKAISDCSYNVAGNIPYECQQINKILFNEKSGLLFSGHEDRQIRIFDPNQSK